MCRNLYENYIMNDNIDFESYFYCCNFTYKNTIMKYDQKYKMTEVKAFYFAFFKNF